MVDKVLANAVILAALSVVAAGGCNTGPPQPVIYRYEAGEYHVECDGEQKKITNAIGRVRIVRNPEDIAIFDGILIVGPKEYGKVVKDDRITVIGDKVSVNGQAREATGPPEALGPPKAIEPPKAAK